MWLQKLSAILMVVGLLFGVALAQEPTVLEVGKPIERELGGGQSHRYQVSLVAGQYLHVVVEQRGIDVLVMLLAPDNKKLTEVDSPNGDQGPEPLMWVAETTGTYQIEVLPLRKDAPTARYEIKVVEIRKAEEKDQDLIEANKATTKATQLFGADKPEEALPIAQQALSLREEVFGKSHPETIPALELLAHLSMYKDDFSSAASVSQQILSIYEKSEGAESLNVAEWIGRLGSIYQKQGDFTKAEPLFLRSLELIKNLSVSNSSKSTRSFEILVLLIGSGGWGIPSDSSDRRERTSEVRTARGNDAEKKVLLYEKVQLVAETVYAKEPLKLVSFLITLTTSVYGLRGEKGEALLKQTLSLVEKAYGTDHPKVAEILLWLASGSQYRVDTERYYQRALFILERSYGAESAQVAAALEQLASYYEYLIPDYSSARLVRERILNVSEKLYGQNHPKLAEALGNTARINKLLGDYSQAESVYLRVLTIREKALGTNTRQVYDTVGSLADLYDKKKEFDKAESFYQKALDISEKITLHPQRKAFLFADIASHYTQAKDYEKAITNYQHGLVLLEKIIPDDPILCWRVLTPLASVYYSAGDYVKAEATLQRALTIYQKFYGTTYESTIDAIRSLALYYARRGDVTQALSYLSKACTEGERLISLSLSFGTERQKTQTLTRRNPEFAYALSASRQLAPNNAMARDLALTLILQRKARVLETTSDSLAFLRRNATPQTQALLNELSAVNTKLAEMLLSGNEAEPRGISAPNTPPANRGQQIQSLELQKEKLEAEISKQSAAFRKQVQPITLANVRNIIPANAALLEFFAYRPFNFKAVSGENPNGPPHYIVYVARRQGEVQWVDLGERKPIDDAIAAWRRALRDANRADVNQLARIVDEKVMQPVRKLLGDTRQLLISPDGQLNLIPFAALVDEQNRYLAESYQLSYLTSGRDLLRLQDPLPNKSETTIVADPDFGTVATASAESNASTTARVEAIHFQPLSGAAREARELKALLPNATLLTKAQATETAVKRLSGPRILHIATHGFFLQTETPELPETRGLGFGREDLDEARLAKFVAQVKDPLIRSGLALAGANQGKSGPNKEDDGVLTALEAAGLDLWGTKLVVLSACDTGIGEVKNGEGVQGLRRAMVLAGAETQVMSLWPVSDNATRDLMVEYYERLQAGEGRGEALRQVQLNLLKGDGVRGVKPLQEGKAAFSGRSHPYYWASFIQSGEWANLEGKR